MWETASHREHSTSRHTDSFVVLNDNSMVEPEGHYLSVADITADELTPSHTVLQEHHHNMQPMERSTDRGTEAAQLKKSIMADILKQRALSDKELSLFLVTAPTRYTESDPLVLDQVIRETKRQLGLN